MEDLIQIFHQLFGEAPSKDEVADTTTRLGTQYAALISLAIVVGLVIMFGRWLKKAKPQVIVVAMIVGVVMFMLMK